MKYSDILKNPHFNNLAAIVRVPFLSHDWKKQHPQVPFWTLISNFDRATKSLNKVEIIEAFTSLFFALTTADERLSYSEDDLNWFVGVLDGDPSDALVTLSMFKAWFSAPTALVTPTEIAEQTGTNESTWRNQAADGEIPGAIKKGKQWLIPVSVLRSRGFDVTSSEMETDFPDAEDESA